jgi:hypothetical protein
MQTSNIPQKGPCVYKGQYFKDIIVGPNLHYSVNQVPKSASDGNKKRFQHITFLAFYGIFVKLNFDSKCLEWGSHGALMKYIIKTRRKLINDQQTLITLQTQHLKI